MKLAIAGAAAGIMALILAAPAAGETPGTPPATQSATLPPTPTDRAPVNLSALVKMLGSDDYAVRQSAAEMLNHVDASRRDELEALAGAARDPEVKAGLWQRLNAIDDDLAINPSSIHIQLDDADAAKVAEALNKQLQMPFGFEQRPDDKSERYTLPATDASYWDVIAELHEQHPLMVVRSDSDDRTVLREVSPRDGTQNVPLTYRVHKDGLAVLPMPLRKNGAGPGAQYIFQCGVTADPRMTVLCHTMPIVQEIVDDQGNILLLNPNTDNANWQFDQSRVWSAGVSFPALANGGKKIASIKGVVQVILMARSDHVDIDPLKRPENVLEVGGHRFVFQQINSGGYVQFTQIDWSPMTLDDQFTNQPLPLFVSSIDENGTAMMWRPMVSASFSSSLPTGGGGAGKSKIRLTVPTRTLTVTWPFEIKDIPLPDN